jgi:hypothetical protein
MKVIDILEESRKNHTPIRIFYGDDNGEDWMEENNVIGYVSTNSGINKLPILMSRHYGEKLLDKNVKRITIDKKEVYRASNYHLKHLSILTNAKTKTITTYIVCSDNEQIAIFDTEKQAENYIKFMKGERNKK